MLKTKMVLSFQYLPCVIIQELIVPYLTVYEVHALQRTNKKLFEILHRQYIYRTLFRYHFPGRPLTRTFVDWKKRYGYALKQLESRSHRKSLTCIRKNILDVSRLALPDSHQLQRIWSIKHEMAIYQWKIRWSWLISKQRTRAVQNARRKQLRSAQRFHLLPSV